MKLLLITGAGASRELGNQPDKMPLMTDWENALCDALDAEEQGLAAGCHLARDESGPQFEQNLGLLLSWQRIQSLQDHFFTLGGESPNTHNQYMIAARDRANRRREIIKRVIDTTLYEQFGSHRIDDRRAREAYFTLLQALGEPEFVVATTNYDRSVESALENLDYRVMTGFERRGQRTPKLVAEGLFERRGSNIPVLHLHGAVGWYQAEDGVEDHYADKPLNPSLGTPVVLYPDPNKDPTSHEVVSQLWRELNRIIAWADHILVIGHSLHDAPLRRVLLMAALNDIPVGISYLDDKEKPWIEHNIGTQHIHPIRMQFGPKPDWDSRALRVWQQ
jgi:hypothetical protein